jgi:hypothetical protein
VWRIAPDGTGIAFTQEVLEKTVNQNGSGVVAASFSHTVTPTTVDEHFALSFDSGFHFNVQNPIAVGDSWSFVYEAEMTNLVAVF